MSDQSSHKGIFYSVTNVGDRCWKWQVVPPNGVKELYAESGETRGERGDAVIAAQRAIDRQTGRPA